MASSTLIILFSKMLKFSKIISSKSKNIAKENSEYFRIFHLLRWIFQNYLIIWQTCVEMAKVLHVFFFTYSFYFFINYPKWIEDWGTTIYTCLNNWRSLGWWQLFVCAKHQSLIVLTLCTLCVKVFPWTFIDNDKI